MTNSLRRLWPRRRATASITMGVHVVVVPKPIPLKERKLGPGDCWNAACWFGKWDGCIWVWRWNWYAPPGRETHWLPASVEILPARCCPPEVQP